MQDLNGRGLHTFEIRSLASGVSSSSSTLIGSLMILSKSSLLFSDQNGGCHDHDHEHTRRDVTTV